MALLEKIAGANDDSGVRCKIPSLHFWATISEIALGEVTKAQAATYWGSDMGGSWDASDSTDLDWIMAEYDSQANASAKALWMSRFLGIVCLVEIDAPGYTTNADIKARIQRL